MSGLGNRSHHYADVTEVKLAGAEPGLGFYRLKFTVVLLSWPVRENEAAGTLFDIQGDLRVGVARNATSPLARLSTVAGLPETQHNGRSRWTAELVADVPRDRIEAVEDLRRGRDLHFVLDVRGLALEAGGEPGWSRAELHLVVNTADWLKALGDMGYAKYLTIEIPMVDPAEAPHLARAIERLREAHEEFLRGRDKKVMEACRHVLEALGVEAGGGHGTRAELRAALEHPEQMTKDKRLLAIRYTMFVMSCLAAHSKDDVSIATTWDRHEARGLLTMTAAVVQWLAEEHAQAQR